MNQVTETFSPHQITASGNVLSGAGKLGGIFVSTASNTPTITIYDDAATGTSTKIVDTFTPVSGTFYRLPFGFGKGCNVVITGTVSCTVGLL